MKDQLKVNATLVDALGSALRSGEHGLKTVPSLLKRVLSEESWRSFVTQRGEVVEYEGFAQFVVTPPLKGLGATVDLLRRVVADDPVTVDLLDRALQVRPGGDRSKSNNVTAAQPAGNQQAKALRRLRKDAPDLHAEVLAGHLSAHAAMVKAGFRPRTASVRLDDPEAVVRTLRKNMDPEQWEALRRLVTDAG